jgi:hypothetical protein
MQKRQSLELHKTFSPLLYSIWNTQQSIADILGINKMDVSRIVTNETNVVNVTDSAPLLYSICSPFHENGSCPSTSHAPTPASFSAVEDG